VHLHAATHPAELELDLRVEQMGGEHQPVGDIEEEMVPLLGI
jgi:hypothetical protein